MINILITSNYGSLKGGGQRSISYILRDLDRSSFSPILLCQEKGDLTEYAAKLKISVELLKIPKIYDFFASVKYVAKIRKLIKRYDIQIIHSECLDNVILGALARWVLGAKIVWHVRVMPENAFKILSGLLMSDAVICVSKAVKKAFPRSKKVFVAENGVDPEESSDPGIFMEYAMLKSVGYFAEISRHKGIEILLRSFPEVIKAFPGAKLLIAGAGSADYVEQLKKLSERLRISGSVIWHGYERGGIYKLINTMNVVIAPFISGEGLSRTVLEAMAQGKAVIASDIPQNRELINDGDTGVLAKKGDPMDLSVKIIDLLKDSGKRDLVGQNAKSHILKNYTLKQTMEKIYIVYRSLGCKC